MIKYILNLCFALHYLFVEGEMRALSLVLMFQDVGVMRVLAQTNTTITIF